MAMIKLTDLIRLLGVELHDFKIHCATGSNPTPLEEFFDGAFQEWQEDQNQENFKCQQIISLIHLHDHRWLFAGVYEVLGVKPGWRKERCFKYETRPLPGLDDLTGRAIIWFEKTFRASYLRGPKYADRLQLLAILDRRMTIGDFPGFNQIRLSYCLLRTVVNQANPSWKTVLSNVSGVYLVTDTTTGKHYVGSAYGGEGVWQRWLSYVKSGHGGNKELRELLQTKGEDHVMHLQFSLLEVCDLNSGEDYVIDRETHWKKVLMSREFGLNKN